MTISRFFDEYPRFQETSATTPQLNRLNTRHQGIVENQRSWFEGARVLDLGSHDGRWTFAALKAGASFVTGIEGREYLASNACKTFEEYGISREKFRFIIGDVDSELEKLSARDFDLVLVLGILYHLRSPFSTLARIAALSPERIIIDTAISMSSAPVIELRHDDPVKESDSIDLRGDNRKILVGYPSESALFLMMEDLGYASEKIGYRELGVTDYSFIPDYESGGRITIRCVRK
ncbi:MAG: class I SAM-dependent methyltransferase [Planctomycetes bacterium]|nr:class I SAM-dependent methyltransferase [Planctomycetota bacterium]